MYGKFFASTFTGSMFGAGPDVFALWGYVIATATFDGTVEVNPAFVAAVLGTTPDRVEAALHRLCSPDPHSRSQEEDGCRLTHEGAFQYRVVNHGHYRAMRNEEERRAYNREAKRRERSSRVKQGVIDKPRVKQDVIDKNEMSTMSAHTDTDTDTEVQVPPLPPKGGGEGFDEFFAAYPDSPNKRASKWALKVWKRLKPDAELRATIMTGLEREKASPQWTKDGGQFVPTPQKWLDEKRWERLIASTPTSPPAVPPMGDVMAPGALRKCQSCGDDFDPPRFKDGTAMRTYSCEYCHRMTRENPGWISPKAPPRYVPPPELLAKLRQPLANPASQRIDFTNNDDDPSPHRRD